MSDLKTDGQWPDLAEPYASALHEAVAFISDRFDPIGIVASGTVLRGTPDPASDLDLFVVHQPLWRQRLQRVFRGVPAEIFVNPPAAIRKTFKEEQADGRPIAAHMLATGVVLLSRDPVVELLRKEAADVLSTAEPSEEPLTMRRYFAASMLEDATDVAARDPATCTALAMQAVIAMLQYEFRRRGSWVPRGKELVSATSVIDAELGALAERFFLEGSLENRLALAGQIADRTIQARGFFEWESSIEAVDPGVGAPEHR